jgi:hypothetical protein
MLEEWEGKDRGHGASEPTLTCEGIKTPGPWRRSKRCLIAYLKAALLIFTPLTRMSPVTSPVDLCPESTSRRVVLPAEEHITA